MHTMLRSAVFKGLFTVAGLALLSTDPASALTFTNRASFEANATVTLTEDFESLVITSSPSITGPTTLPSGITVSSESNDLFIVDPGQSTNPTKAIGSNLPRADSLFVDLAGDFSAFGVDVFQNNAAGFQFVGNIAHQLSLFDDGALVAAFVFNVAPNGGSFFGITLGILFDEVQIFSLANSFEVIDNVTAGLAPVPLPAALPLFGTGLGIMGFIGWRRKRRMAEAAA